MNSLISLFRRAFAPSRLDGPFFILWIFVLTPLVAGYSVYRGDLEVVNVWGVVGAFYFMMLGVTLGFHRYFSHRSYQTSRFFQFVLGFMGTMSGQTGPLSWSLSHENHHKNCETAGDQHSTNVGFWHAHGFYLWSGKSRNSNLEDSYWFKFPELVLLEVLAPILFYSAGITLWIVGGFGAAVWYWLVPTFLAFNSTMMINSLGHGHGMFSYKDYHQPEHCRATNIPWAWPFILGDNWHNNHHAYPSSAAHGFEWWEIDPNRYFLAVLKALRVVRRPILPNARQLERSKASRATMPAPVRLAPPPPYDPKAQHAAPAE